MRHFYLFAAAVLTAATAVAAPAQPKRVQALQQGLSLDKTGTAIVKDGKTVGRVAADARKARLHGPRINEAAPISDNIIEERPAGTATDYYRNSIGYLVLFETPYPVQDYGYSATVINGDDGKTYINHPFSQFPIQSWMECIIDEGTLTIPGGQAVYMEIDEEDDKIHYGYVVGLVGEKVWDEDWQDWFVDYQVGDNQDFSFDIVDGKLVSQDPERLLGICGYDEDGYYWLGYGDYGMTYTLYEGHATEPPAGLETEKWACLSEEGGHFVQIGFEGDNVWVQNMFPTCPDKWIQGKNQDGKVVFENGQLVGVDYMDHYAFLTGGVIEEYWNEEWEFWDEALVAGPALEFSYDAEGRRLWAEGRMVLNSDPSGFWFTAFVTDPVIEFQEVNPNSIPAAPYDVWYYPYDEWEGFAKIEFRLPNFDTEGQLLDVEDMYYEIIIDDEPFEFYADEYSGLRENMVQVPCDFYDNHDFFVTGDAHAVFFYFEGLDTIGVRQCIKRGDKEFWSDITWDDVYNAAVKGVGADAQTAAACDLLGRSVEAGARGLVIEKRVDSEGNTVWVKNLRK